MTKIYIFDVITKEYLKEETALTDPIVGGELVPSNGTMAVPMETVPDGCSQIFNTVTSQWDIIGDFRGTEVFECKNMRFGKITKLGNLPHNTVIVDDIIKAEYLENPEYFEVTNTTFRKLNEKEKITVDVEIAKKKKRYDRQQVLDETDWMVQRAEDAKRIGIRSAYDINSLVEYRQYLRDLTNQNNWWKQDILTLEQWREEL